MDGCYRRKLLPESQNRPFSAASHFLSRHAHHDHFKAEDGFTSSYAIRSLGDLNERGSTMFSFLRKRRRARLLAEAFSAESNEILRRNVPYADYLTADAAAR